MGERIGPENAVVIAVECQRRARELREEARQLLDRRDEAVRVACGVGRERQVDVAAALEVTPTQVRHIMNGRRGGGHLTVREVYGEPSEPPPIELERWLDHPGS